MKAPSDVGSIQFEKVSYSTANTVLPNLTVLNDSGSYDPTFHYYNIIGLVRNDDTVLVKFVNVVATLYNAASVPISCDFTYVSSTDLDVGQTSSFRLITSGRDFSDVVSYKLQADGNRQ